MITSWPCPLIEGGFADELLVTHGAGGSRRILVIPPLFDEHNKLRRQIVTVMRRLGDGDCELFLPDLPGWNESLEPLSRQTLGHWRHCIDRISIAMDIDHVLAFRSGALLAPADRRGWLYEPQNGASLLRRLVRARVIASREAGQEERSEVIVAVARQNGAMFGGWEIGAGLFTGLEAAVCPDIPNFATIAQESIGGQALWLRAEPDEDLAQAHVLARLIAEDLAVPE